MSKSLNLSTIHERIRYARDKAGFNQKAFAAELNISPGNWSKIEGGTLSVKYDLIERINAILELDIRYYFGLISYEEALTKVKAGAEGDMLIELAKKSDRQKANLRSFIAENDALVQRLASSFELQQLIRFLYKCDADEIKDFSNLAMFYSAGLKRGKRQIDKSTSE